MQNLKAASVALVCSSSNSFETSFKVVQPVTISHGDVSNNTGKPQCCSMFYDLQNNMMYLICDSLRLKHHFWNFS